MNDTVAVRRANILRMRRSNPCVTLQVIGDEFGVTRERVRQILLEEGKPTVAYRQTYLCTQCGKDVGVVPKLFCSPKCRHEYGHIKIACTYCGQLKEYNVKQLVWYIKHGRHGTDFFFCSKRCQGRWLVENHGFTAHPENAMLGHRKYDWSKVYALRDETGWGAVRIGRALGISESGVSKILAKRTNIRVTEKGFYSDDLPTAMVTCDNKV